MNVCGTYKALWGSLIGKHIHHKSVDMFVSDLPCIMNMLLYSATYYGIAVSSSFTQSVSILWLMSCSGSSISIFLLKCIGLLFNNGYSTHFKSCSCWKQLLCVFKNTKQLYALSIYSQSNRDMLRVVILCQRSLDDYSLNNLCLLTGC